jgi:cobalt/nickel transport system permease protein
MSEARGTLDWSTGAGTSLDTLDPRSRVLTAFALVLACIASPGLGGPAVALAVALLLVVLARLDLHALAHRLLHLEGFMLVLLVLLPFTMPGTPLLTLGPLAASAEGLHRATLIVLKVNACAILVLALVATLGPVKLAQALARLGMPDTFVQLLLFTIRYVDVFRDERQRIWTAIRARGFVPGASRHALTTYGRLIGLLVVRALDRADRVAAAMALRGFDGTVPRRHAMAFTRIDLLAAALALCAVALVSLAGWTG